MSVDDVDRRLLFSRFCFRFIVVQFNVFHYALLEFFSLDLAHAIGVQLAGHPTLPHAKQKFLVGINHAKTSVIALKNGFDINLQLTKRKLDGAKPKIPYCSKIALTAFGIWCFLSRL